MTTLDAALVRRFIRRAQADQSRLAIMVNDVALSILAAQLVSDQIGLHPPEGEEAERIISTMVDGVATLGFQVEEINAALREWEWNTGGGSTHDD